MIIGIDPGPEMTALVAWWDNSVWITRKMESKAVCKFLGDVYLTTGHYEVACEHIQCMGMPVGKEIFETAYWIGEFRHFCQASKIPFHRVYRSEEKMFLCNSVRAKDSNIRQALIDRYGAVGTQNNPGPLFGVSGDMWSALAVAVTFEGKKEKECTTQAQ
jgi:hypothetical protein